MTESHSTRIAVVGGTGPQGRGLGYRLARAGHEVVLGSRDIQRATAAAEELSRLAVGARITGATNLAAAESAGIVLLAVPYDGHAQLVTSLVPALAGKLVVSCVNPLSFDRFGPYGRTVSAGSGAEEAAGIVASATVVGAFHHLAAPLLLDPEADLSHEDVLVCGDDVAAKEKVMALAADVTGGRGLDAGRLRLARQLEPLTAVLISVNKRYKTRSGLALTGLAPAVGKVPA
ncbi:NADPH-dependent F420 reductase [Micromonospora sp. NBC_01655]|uniref:NADPH-dependent F420 reductase n=1 Tax=Micromonospora sp. NBC_01655 TaxID=2975983 RepID=UPI0022537F3C|nr:NADPH-dependent F420 reductase [Micromonospora sp. NBC_01655]MCX4471558.1 NADPH-dependent F420 reductase [Micromonospora sp. NBC_01655]